MRASRLALACLLLGSGASGVAIAACGSSSGGGPGGPGADASSGEAGDDASPGADSSPADVQPADDAGVDSADDADGSSSPDGTPCAADACAGSLTCCSGMCVDLLHDPHNCGSCGNLCTLTQFCTGKKCAEAVLANVCENPAATVLLDPYSGDNEAGASLGQGLATACAPAVAVAQVPLADAGAALDPDSGQPLLGPGNTLVTGGGSFGQPSVAYMDQAGLTSLYLTTDGTTAWFKNRATGTNVVSTAVSSLTAHHDYFFLETAVEPKTGTLCFSGVGMLNPGTLAAGYFGGTQVIPNRATYGHAWYAYEWTDTNNDGAPNAGDTFTLVSAGP